MKRNEDDWLAWANENLPPSLVRHYHRLRGYWMNVANEHRWRIAYVRVRGEA